jgi:hypothetical protein
VKKERGRVFEKVREVKKKKERRREKKKKINR